MCDAETLPEQRERERREQLERKIEKLKAKVKKLKKRLSASGGGK